MRQTGPRSAKRGKGLTRLRQLVTNRLVWMLAIAGLVAARGRRLQQDREVKAAAPDAPEVLIALPSERRGVTRIMKISPDGPRP